MIRPDDQITFASELDANGNTLWYDIATVTSDTALTISPVKVTTVTGGTYKIRKRRNNRIYVLDTRTNLKGRNIGWTIYDGVDANGFVTYRNELLYGSYTNGYLYQYDYGGLLYGSAITASALTKRDNCGGAGIKKFFKAFKTKGKGTGTLYITPYIDGTALTTVQHTFTTNQYEEIYFPNADYGFSGIGYEIQFELEFTSGNEDISIYRPQVGFLPMQRK